MEGDDDELEDSGPSLPQLSTYVAASYFAQVVTRRGIYSRVVFISLSTSNCAAFIRG